MDSHPKSSQVVSIQTSDGNTVYVRATMEKIPGEEVQVSGGPTKWIGGITEAIKLVAQQVQDGFDDIKPKKTTVEFGLELSLQTGKLLAILTDASQKASIKVTLEW